MMWGFSTLFVVAGQFETAGEATAVGGRAKQTDVHTTSWAVGDSNPTGLCVPALT